MKLNIKIIIFFCTLFYINNAFSQSEQDYYNQGVEKIKVKKYAEAIITFNKAIDINPAFVEAYVNRGLSKGSLLDFIGAINDFETALKFDTENASKYKILFNLGTAKFSTKDFEGAIRCFNQSISINPNFGEAYQNRGITEITIGLKQEGCTDLIKAKELGSKTVDNLIKKYCL